ncbi:required for drug-induced death protein 1 [Macrotis lagotis]|uniref:required for drug-induced death protein 1 n=1 Tax=Macrotis lagotis TaxID=92651 RepID=UPI003D69773A
MGGRLRGKRPGGRLPRFLRRGPEGREEEACIVQRPHLEEEEEEQEEQAWGPEGQPPSPDAQPEARADSRKVHFAFLPQRYEPLEEQVAGGKPKKRCRKKLQKYGKNVGKVITKGCRYFVIGLQGLATAYASPFASSAALLSLVR